MEAQLLQHHMNTPGLLSSWMCVQLDWSSALVGGGFQFKNPNASASCGCGKSFGV